METATREDHHHQGNEESASSSSSCHDNDIRNSPLLAVVASDNNPNNNHGISTSTLSSSGQPVFTIGENNEVLLAELLSSDQVSQLMREQDADLLERMHYAASQVSQYSPGATPDLKPMVRSSIEDDPLMLTPFHLSDSDFLVENSASPGDNSRPQSIFQAASFQDLIRTSSSAPRAAAAALPSGGGGGADSSPSHVLLMRGRNGNRTSSSQHDNHSRTGSGGALGRVKELDSVVSWDMDESTDVVKEESSPPAATASAVLPPLSSTTPSRFRRLLSGEIRTLEPSPPPPMDDSSSSHHPQPPTTAKKENEDEEEETTASPISVAQEAAAVALEQQQKKETALAEQRRFQEAMQFAEAVGESRAINREDLCIIEDHTEDSEDDDDDEDACKSKEIVVDDPDAIQDSLSASQSNLDMLNANNNNNPVANFQDAQEGNLTPLLPSHVDVPPRPELSRRISKRPLWPFGPAGSDYDRFLDHVSDGLNRTNFVYKGICANPPEITKAGIQRGNYAQLHRKAWLEVSDKYHRYGKNLRLYYRYWERLGFPTNQFFDWLDSKGEAAGQPLPNLEECPRSVLDSDTVLYIGNPEVTEGYALDIVCNEEGRGRIIDVDSSPVMTGPDGWIFVLRDNVMYGAEKITSISGHSKQRFHHSSFFGGKAVAAAGIIITDELGYLTRLYPHSGHYRPSESHMQRMLFFLHRKGVDLRTFEMDTQQFRHVSREKDAAKPRGDGDKKKDKSANADGGKDSEKKLKKVDSLHMEKAVNVACFLAHKASFIGNGIFDSIHKIRKADVTSVSEALDLVDNGGFWNNRPVTVDDEVDTDQDTAVLPIEKGE